jgi:hypothetical protein
LDADGLDDIDADAVDGGAGGEGRGSH